MLLQCSSGGHVVLDDFTSTVRKLMDERSPVPATFMEFIVSAAGLRPSPEQASVEFLRSSCASRPQPDLVITSVQPS